MKNQELGLMLLLSVRTIIVGKARDFFGVLYDLDNVAGIIVTKVGYQKGAKGYANYYGIGLKELRTPNNVEDGIIGQTELDINISIRHCLFLIDEQYSETNKFSLSRYKQWLDSFDFNHRWIDATYVPLEIKDCYIRDADGRIISSFDKLEKELPEDSGNRWLPMRGIRFTIFVFLLGKVTLCTWR